jgi:hypothetical protein
VELFIWPTTHEANAIINSSVATFEDGTAKLYFSAVSDEVSMLHCYKSLGGASWESVTFNIGNIASGYPLKLLPAEAPNVIRYYYNGTDEAEINSYNSSDGETFISDPGTRLTTVGTTYDSASIIMGSAIRLANGQVRLYYSGSNTSEASADFVVLSATSEDGLNFTKEKGIRLISSKGTAMRPCVLKDGGKYVMYYGTDQYIYKASSKDGLHWTELGSTGVAGADPSIQVLSGYWRMFYSKTDPATGKPSLYTAFWIR